jgi:hypothetical protein
VALSVPVHLPDRAPLCSYLVTSFGANWEGIKYMGEKVAAAILVQTLFSRMTISGD